MTAETDARELAGALRATGKYRGDDHVKAAVELLAWHDYWLRRADFTKACIRTFAGDVVIAWQQAREFAAARPGCTMTQLNVLRFAVALGSDEFGLSGMGSAHASALGRALAIALGMAYDGTPFAPPEITPGIDELRGRVWAAGTENGNG